MRTMSYRWIRWQT